MSKGKTAVRRRHLSNCKILLLWWSLAPLLLPAQHPLFQDIFLRFDPDEPREGEVTHRLIFDRPLRPGDTLWFYDYLHAYSNPRTSLGEAIAGHYKLEFHFAKRKERGFLIPRPDSAYVIVRHAGLTGFVMRDSVSEAVFRYRIRLPSAKFTGLGAGKDFIHWRDFFLQPLVYTSRGPLRYAHKNLDDRPHLPLPTRIRITPSSLYPHWQSNARIRRRGDTIELTHPHNGIEFLAGRRPFTLIHRDSFTLVLEEGVLDRDLPATAQAWDSLIVFLKNRGFPLPSKILVTRRDLRIRPVYGLDMLPVLNPFPRDFQLHTRLLKQILYKGGRELFWDARADRSVWTGLWQFYMKKYVETEFPEVRLTGNPVRWPVVRGYYMFNAPYTAKYKQAYLYMARMNRDQALRLPADSLTLFNRKITHPYKAALGWEWVYDRLGDSLFTALVRRQLEIARTRYVLTEDWQAALIRRGGQEACFPCGDFYRTAFKADYALRHKGDSLRIRMKGDLAIPLTLERHDEASMSVRRLPPLRRDTALAAPSARYYTLNARNPLPEIREKDNLAPRRRKPVKIRLWQDLEDPHSVQLFVNPDADYNYYNGLILGMSLNNRTFFDKPLVWEIIPDYGFKSRTLNGYASFKWKKHFVRPYLHGFSVGGYFSSYHYDTGKPYRNMSLYATLSHKNRKAKFFRENDLTLEWLRLERDDALFPVTSRYGVVILSDTWRSRGLLKNTRWKTSAEWHPLFAKIYTDFRFRRFVDKVRQVEWRIFAGWMPYNRTGTDFFSFALSRPTDYLFKHNYYGRSENSGIFYQQYVYAEGAFKVFFSDQYADRWIFTHNIYIGLWKRLNLFADFGWLKHTGSPTAFHYDGGLRYYLVPDYIEFYFPLFYDGRLIPLDRTYPSRIRIMFVFDIQGLTKMFTRSWY
ncbi:MAG: hypothetical protein GXO27_01425 [Chlorobi bacterium]|nr:hypothetical protein [Chlorobiota bacterium]